MLSIKWVFHYMLFNFGELGKNLGKIKKNMTKWNTYILI